MADKIPDLHASVRAGTGKGAARQARRDGDVPGIVYGGGIDPQPISINYNMLLKKLRAGRFMATLHNLKVEGQEDVRVICRGVQRHVVKDLPTHIDLMRLKRTSRVSIFISVDFINEKDCPGLKQGGNLTVVRNEVELNVLAGEIPENIVIDLAGLEIGDTINISDVSLPEGAKPTIDRDFVIANLDAPRAMLAEDDEDEDAPAADEVPTGDAEEAKEE